MLDRFIRTWCRLPDHVALSPWLLLIGCAPFPKRRIWLYLTKLTFWWRISTLIVSPCKKCSLQTHDYTDGCQFFHLCLFSSSKEITRLLWILVRLCRKRRTTLRPFLQWNQLNKSDIALPPVPSGAMGGNNNCDNDLTCGNDSFHSWEHFNISREQLVSFIGTTHEWNKS